MGLALQLRVIKVCDPPIQTAKAVEMRACSCDSPTLLTAVQACSRWRPTRPTFAKSVPVVTCTVRLHQAFGQALTGASLATHLRRAAHIQCDSRGLRRCRLQAWKDAMERAVELPHRSRTPRLGRVGGSRQELGFCAAAGALMRPPLAASYRLEHAGALARRGRSMWHSVQQAEPGQRKRTKHGMQVGDRRAGKG